MRDPAANVTTRDVTVIGRRITSRATIVCTLPWGVR